VNQNALVLSGVDVFFLFATQPNELVSGRTEYFFFWFQWFGYREIR